MIYHELECDNCENSMYIEKGKQSKEDLECVHCGNIGEFTKMATVKGSIDIKKNVLIKCGNCKNIDTVSMTSREMAEHLPSLECPECNMEGKCFIYIEKGNSIADTVGSAKDKLPSEVQYLFERAKKEAGTLYKSGGTNG